MKSIKDINSRIEALINRLEQAERAIENGEKIGVSDFIMGIRLQRKAEIQSKIDALNWVVEND